MVDSNSGVRTELPHEKVRAEQLQKQETASRVDIRYGSVS